MLSLYLVLCATVFFGEATIYYQEDAAKLFDKFIIEYDRHYESEGEYQRRFSVFKQKLVEINDLNEKNGDAVFGITKFADFTEEELQRMVGIKYNSSDPNLCPLKPVKKTKSPDAFDWRDKNVVTPAKNQEISCGSCWAFSTTGSLESKNAIKTGKLLELSQQQLVDCDEYGHGCSGATLDAGIKYFIEKGAMTAQDYPYKAHEGQCKYNQSEVVVKPTSCESFDTAGKEDAVASLLVQNGPLSVAVADQVVWFYRGGIMKFCPGPINLAALLVGYGTEKNVLYWISKNSWGANFGEKGYFRILRGENVCKITNTPMVAVNV